MRLNKFLASCGLGSRRACEELIKSGQIKVNSRVIVNVATEIDPEKDTAFFNEKRLAPATMVYYLLNKPIGYTSSLKDVHAKNLISELVPANPPVWPVGRLDKNTSGLILLTNDGDLTYQLTHPKYQKEKEYLIKTDSSLKQDEISQLLAGINLDDGFVKADFFEKIDEHRSRIIIHEGRKRLVRRMISFFNKKVISLERIRISTICLGKIRPGQYRTLTNEEIVSLKND